MNCLIPECTRYREDQSFKITSTYNRSHYIKEIKGRNKRKKFTKMGLGAGEAAINIFHKAFTHEAPLPITSSLCLHSRWPQRKAASDQQGNWAPRGGGLAHCRSRDVVPVCPWLPSPSCHLCWKDRQSRHRLACRGCQKGHTGEGWHAVNSCRGGY